MKLQVNPEFFQAHFNLHSLKIHFLAQVYKHKESSFRNDFNQLYRTCVRTDAMAQAISKVANGEKSSTPFSSCCPIHKLRPEHSEVEIVFHVQPKTNK